MPTYRIGKLASRARVRTDTIRFYERIGLLPAPSRTSGGVRVYAEETLERLFFIKQAQMLGFSLREIGVMVRGLDSGTSRSVAGMEELLRAKLSAVDGQLESLTNVRARLAEYVERCARSNTTVGLRAILEGLQAEDPTVERGLRPRPGADTAQKRTITSHHSVQQETSAHHWLLAGAVHDLSLASAVDEISSSVCQYGRLLTHADGVTFALRSGEDCCYVGEDAVAPLWKNRRLPLRACMSGWVIMHNTAAIIQDVSVDSRIPHDLYRATFVRSLAIVPVGRTSAVAALGAYWAVKRVPREDELQALRALASATLMALESRRIRTPVAVEVA